ncbi:hypothetical protein DFJ77DRAFT_285060 [Powellomyces hirtus]|nr:hypothetical protein DFJ77DRAFT_285060 [Powellomyces hirtus]
MAGSVQGCRGRPLVLPIREISVLVWAAFDLLVSVTVTVIAITGFVTAGTAASQSLGPLFGLATAFAAVHLVSTSGRAVCLYRARCARIANAAMPTRSARARTVSHSIYQCNTPQTQQHLLAPTPDEVHTKKSGVAGPVQFTFPMAPAQKLYLSSRARMNSAPMCLTIDPNAPPSNDRKDSGVSDIGHNVPCSPLLPRALPRPATISSTEPIEIIIHRPSPLMETPAAVQPLRKDTGFEDQKKTVDHVAITVHEEKDVRLSESPMAMTTSSGSECGHVSVTIIPMDDMNQTTCHSVVSKTPIQQKRRSALSALSVDAPPFTPLALQSDHMTSGLDLHKPQPYVQNVCGDNIVKSTPMATSSAAAPTAVFHAEVVSAAQHITPTDEQRCKKKKDGLSPSRPCSPALPVALPGCPSTEPRRDFIQSFAAAAAASANPRPERQMTAKRTAGRTIKYDTETLLSLRSRASDISGKLRAPAEITVTTPKENTVIVAHGPDGCPLLSVPVSCPSPSSSATIGEGGTIDMKTALIPHRKWVNAQMRKARTAAEFSVMTWNVLAPMYLTREKFPALEPQWREWGYRKAKLLDEVIYYSTDVVCLQELTLEDFETFFAPRLHALGYAGVYREKMRAPSPLQSPRPTSPSSSSTTDTTFSSTSSDSGTDSAISLSLPSPPGADGCAFFYNTRTFHPIAIDTFSYPELASKMLDQTHDVSVDVLRFPNTGIHALLKHAKTGNYVRVVTTHLHWNPANERTKLLQAAMLMEYLANNSFGNNDNTNSDDERKSNSRKSHRGQHQQQQQDKKQKKHGVPDMKSIPIVLAGDLNSMRGERVMEFLQTGAVDVTGDWGWVGKDYASLTVPAWPPTLTLPPPSSPSLKPLTISTTPTHLTNPLKFTSAYPVSLLPYTNKTTTFEGTIDHVLYTANTLSVKDVLGPVEEGWLVGDGVKSLPTASCVSDHLCLAVCIAWKQQQSGNGSGNSRGNGNGSSSQVGSGDKTAGGRKVARGCGKPPSASSRKESVGGGPHRGGNSRSGEKQHQKQQPHRTGELSNISSSAASSASHTWRNAEGTTTRRERDVPSLKKSRRRTRPAPTAANTR